jgi:thiol-disulfide isomerase/thioredoxin
VRQAFNLGVLLALIATSPSAAIGNALEPPILRSNSSQFILLKPTNPAPTMPLQGLNGSVVDLSQYRGKVIVLNFWATWCLPCAYEMPSLDRLGAIADPTKLAVITVAIDQAGATSVERPITDPV